MYWIFFNSTAKKVGEGEYYNATASYRYDYDIDEGSRYNTLYPKSIHVGYGLVDAEAAINKAIKYREELISVSNEFIPDDLLSNLKEGWNFLGTENEIVNFNIFDDVAIVWCFIDGLWKGYSPNLEYAKALRMQDKLLINIPGNSGFWVYQDAS